MRYWFLLLLSLALPVQADDVPSDCDAGTHCVTEQQLYLSLALGYGQRSNPLYGGEALPLVILPEVYYYAEHWFFDNGVLGSSWQLNPQFTLSLVGQFNQEKGYFQKWFAGNAFQFRSTNASISSPILQDDRYGPQQASVREARKRPTAFDLGVQLDWFNNNWQVQGLVWQDVSNSYNGQHASISATRFWQTVSGKWQLSSRLHWKSNKLIDTYYGIDNNEAFYLPRYNGKASWQPEIRLGWQYPLSTRVALLAFLRYLHLDDAMTDSPLVQDNNVTTWFFGISYRLF